MSILRVPTIPNSPLQSREDRQRLGLMRLRINESLNFIENAEFDSSLATYDDNYQNSQTHSALFMKHMQDVLELLKSQFPKGSQLVEVGCGKGGFVELVQADGYFKITGYDATYEGTNPSIYKRYLDSNDRIETDIIILRHVLEHIQRPHLFLSMLKDVFVKAQIYIEVPNYDWISQNQAFFDITYEHVNYFSQYSLRALFGNSGLKTGLCFGEQYQYLIANIESLSRDFAELYREGNWQDLDFEKLFPHISEKISLIEHYLPLDSKLYVWGAATKGCMFLVHCAHQGKLLDRIGFAIDANPQKCGKFLPGSLVAIKSKEDFYKSAQVSDILLISNPNYKDEIISDLRQHGFADLKILTL